MCTQIFVGYSKAVCAETIVFSTNFVRNIQSEVLGFNNGKSQTPPNRVAAMCSQKLLQTPSSQQVWTVCTHICLVDGWKASQVSFHLVRVSSLVR